tara:strand:- start:63 stop:215 length:153 start_codon:yes stop_codon:yes gene_type:complete
MLGYKPLFGNFLSTQNPFGKKVLELGILPISLYFQKIDRYWENFPLLLGS